MPARKTPLVTNQVYHIVNRGVGSIPICKNVSDYQRLIFTFYYYQHQNPPFRMSRLFSLTKNEREKTLQQMKQNQDYLVEIFAFCLMPNHYHFLLKQVVDNGIPTFIRLTTNSFAKYFNTKHKRKGGLFTGRFKAVLVETDQQLLHLCRYIHLNPYSAFLVKKINDLKNYPYSSLGEYLGLDRQTRCQKELILPQFKDKEDFWQFIVDQADYQRSLEVIKHQMLES